MLKWEYKIVSVTSGRVATMNQMGSDGWEAFAVDQAQVYYKRPMGTAYAEQELNASTGGQSGGGAKGSAGRLAAAAGALPKLDARTSSVQAASGSQGKGKADAPTGKGS